MQRGLIDVCVLSLTNTIIKKISSTIKKLKQKVAVIFIFYFFEFELLSRENVARLINLTKFVKLSYIKHEVIPLRLIEFSKIGFSLLHWWFTVNANQVY